MNKYNYLEAVTTDAKEWLLKTMKLNIRCYYLGEAINNAIEEIKKERDIK